MTLSAKIPQIKNPQHQQWSLTLWLLLAPIVLFLSFSNALADTRNTNVTPPEKVIYFGLLPYLSTAELIKTWKPLADHIGQALHKNVIIKTAPNFKSFVKRMTEGRYDILMTAPHFAALAVKKYNYRVIAGHDNDLAGDIVVAKYSRFQSISDLRDKVFASPDSLAVVSMLAEIALKRAGLTPNEGIHIKNTPSHNTALIDVARGQVAAAVAVNGLYRRINASEKFEPLRKLASTDSVPHVMYIAAPSLNEADFQTLQRALIQPTPNTPGAAAIANLDQQFGWGRITIVSQQKLNRLEPILPLLEAEMAKE